MDKTIRMWKSLVKGTAIAWGMVVLAAVTIAAEETSLPFPKTKEEIVKILSKAPPAFNQFVGQQSEQTDPADSTAIRSAKIEAMLDNEDFLASAPQTGALILFYFDSTTIKPESLSCLQEYGEAFEVELSNAVVVVAGHTDNSGAESYNLGLSKRRAEAVKQYLVSHYEIDERRLLLKAYGERKPIVSNETREGRMTNRRVQFIRIQ